MDNTWILNFLGLLPEINSVLLFFLLRCTWPFLTVQSAVWPKQNWFCNLTSIYKQHSLVLSGRAGGDPELSYCICYEGEEDHYTKPVAAEYARRNADHFSYLSGKRKLCKTYVTQNAQNTFEQQFVLIPGKSSVSCHVKSVQNMDSFCRNSHFFWPSWYSITVFMFLSLLFSTFYFGFSKRLFRCVQQRHLVQGSWQRWDFKELGIMTSLKLPNVPYCW